MKKINLCFLLFLGLAFLYQTGIVTAGTSMSVQVKKAPVRSAPSFFSGKIIKNLAYGNRVAVLSQKGKWIKVAARGATGWMHASALTKKKIIKRAGAGDVEKYARSDEVALAGKGFNKQVEARFMAKNPKISFRWVNRMEAFNVYPSEVRRFLRQGKLSFEGGVQ